MVVIVREININNPGDTWENIIKVIPMTVGELSRSNPAVKHLMAGYLVIK